MLVASAALVAESGNCKESSGTDKREICAGLSGRDKTHETNFIKFVRAYDRISRHI